MGKITKTRIFHREKGHHAVVKALISFRLPALLHGLILEIDGGFEAVMAVGDEEFAEGHNGLQLFDGLGVAECPDGVGFAVVVFALHQRRLGEDGLVHELYGRVLGVGEEQEDVLVVGLGGAQEAQAVGLGAGQRMLVGAYALLLEFDAGDESLASIFPAHEGEGLVIHVDGRLVIHLKHAAFDPIAQGLGGFGIGRFGIGDVFLRKDHADDVVRVAVVIFLLQLAVNLVVGLCDELVEVPGDKLIIAQGLEGSNLSHKRGFRLVDFCGQFVPKYAKSPEKSSQSG